MANNSAKYHTVEEDEGKSKRDSVQARNDACRRYVRKMQQQPILSAEWFELVNILQQLAKLAHLDEAIPLNEKVQDVHGRNSDGGTLWDQEQQENAIRIIVEEAKVNLCLRMMNEYKTFIYSAVERDRAIQAASAEHGMGASQVARKCDLFEESLGLLLKRCFMHIETLQLTDIPLLLEHCQLILSSAQKLGIDPTKNLRVQEAVVLDYFSSLMRHAENLNSTEVLARTRESGLIWLVVDQVLQFCAEFPLELLYSVSLGFSGLADNEDFSSNWQSFFCEVGGPGDNLQLKEKFLELEEKLVGPVLRDAPDKKKEIRPLLDLFNTIKRSIK